MNAKELCELILEKLNVDPSQLDYYDDLFQAIRHYEADDSKQAHIYARDLMLKMNRYMSQNKCSFKVMDRLHTLMKKVLCFDAPVYLDSYIQYIEWNREPKSRFYQPRRKALKPVVDEIQRLHDGEIDILTISLPPGVGKTTTALFALTWWAGQEPEKPILTVSHSNDFLKGAYKELMRILGKDGDYLYNDVFPKSPLVANDAKVLNIDLRQENRFPTLEFTSVGASNAGKLRCQGLLYCDDLCSGIEEAMNEERLTKLWQIYSTDLLQRKIGSDCKELHIATRWSVRDVIGRLEQMWEGSPRAKFLVVPALNDENESNFDFKNAPGYKKEDLMRLQRSMDEASFNALYLGRPIEREGRLYFENELQHYIDLPEGEPDSILAVCDTKDKGNDYCVLPVAYKYGNRYYIDDVLCDNGKPENIDERIVSILLNNKVQMCQFESNSAGGRVAKVADENVKMRNGHCHITTKYTTANKETKIISYSAWVKEYCLFKDRAMYNGSSDYGMFMHLLCSYSMVGKNSHDDAPDAMAMLGMFIESIEGNKVVVFDRPF